MPWIAAIPALIGGAAALFGGSQSAKAAGQASDAELQATQEQIKYLTESRDLARSDQEPYRTAGYAALDAAMSMVGLPSLSSVSSVYGNAAPTSGGTAPAPASTGGLDFSPYQSSLAPGVPLQWASSPGLRTSSYAPVEKRARGGPVAPGQRVMMGERRPEMLVTASGVQPVGLNGPEVMQMTEPGYVVPNPRTPSWAYQRPAPGQFAAAHPYFAEHPDLAQTVISRRFQTNHPRFAGRPRSGIGAPVSTPYATGGPVYPGQTVTVGDIPPPPQSGGGMPGRYNFKTDPGYQFRLSEGTRAVDANAAARGRASSGGTMRALTRYGQQFASNEYTNVYNRISDIAGLGGTAANASGSYAMNAGANMANAAGAAGDARASGYIGQSNAWNTAASGAASSLGTIDWASFGQPQYPNMGG